MDEEKERSTISRWSYASSFVGHTLLAAILLLSFLHTPSIPLQRLIEVELVATTSAAPESQEPTPVHEAPLPEPPTPEVKEQISPTTPDVAQQIQGSPIQRDTQGDAAPKAEASVNVFMEAIHDAAPLYNPPPHYPPAARRKGQQGTVMLEVSITPWGTVEEIALLRSSGHTSLDESAVAAVRNWRFTPASHNGETQTARLRLPVVFRLN